MDLSDDQLLYFDRAVLKLPQDRRRDYLDQVDYLVKRLRQKIAEDSSFGVVDFILAGSLAKGTMVKPRDGIAPDADLAVYLDVEEAAAGDIDRLHDIIRRLLISAYPTKNPRDFEVQPRTLGIRFHGTGLEVDLVPVVAIPDTDGYGWQPSARGEAAVKTSVRGQLNFIRSRRKGDPFFRVLARMAKRWRNHQKGDVAAVGALGSFAIELLLAHLQDTDGAARSIEQGLSRFFLYIADSKLQKPVMFREHGPVGRLPTDTVVILDPVNGDNNVTRRMTSMERDAIVERAESAWDRLNTAYTAVTKGETLEMWEAIVGTPFRIEASS